MPPDVGSETWIWDVYSSDVREPHLVLIDIHRSLGDGNGQALRSGGPHGGAAHARRRLNCHLGVVPFGYELKEVASLLGCMKIQMEPPSSNM